MKVMEHMLLKSILNWVMTSITFHKRYFGFLQNSGSTRAIDLFLQDIECV